MLIPIIGAGTTGSVAATDPNWANVELLLKFNGSDASTTITDSSTNGTSCTASGDAQLDTAKFKFGGSSLLLDGTGDYVTVTGGGSELAPGSGDFTIEFWIWWNSVSGTQVMYEPRDSGSAGRPVIYKNSSDKLIFYDNSALISGTTTLTTGAWHHIALSKNSGSTRMYLNGVQEGSTYSDSTTYTNPTGYPRIGVQDGGAALSNYVNGWIDSLRVTIGTGRYPTAFTPPTEEFPTS